MRISLTELIVIVDTLYQSQLIAGDRPFNYDRETRNMVLKDMITQLNKEHIIVKIDRESNEKPN